MKIYTHSKKIIADHLTPIAAFNKLRDEFEAVSLFESSDYHDRKNSKSFICGNPIISLKVQSRKLELTDRLGFIEKKEVNSIVEVQDLLNGYEFVNKEKAALNGLFGVIGYDAIPLMEDIQFKTRNRFTKSPEVLLNAYEFVLIFDNFTNEIEVLINDFEEKEPNFNMILDHLRINFSIQSHFQVNSERNTNIEPDTFLELIGKAKENIAYGDVFQLVLSRSFSQNYEGDEFQVYRALRSINPSPYMFYLNLQSAILLGASPEAHLVIKNGVAEIHPIAGTMKKTGVKEEDLALMEQLKNDPKENAEHNMLVDLARNDLNVSCTDVEVNQFKEIQEFSHVIHMVSKVTGKAEAKEGFNLETLAMTFPAGTLSGAPKYKAMELIDEYEHENRGYYGGIVGHFSPNGDLNTAIVIRSCFAHEGTLNYQAGAGIVKDSVPQSELEEIYNKVGAVESAISLANEMI